MWGVVAYILIKSVLITGYNPEEDLTELGAGVLATPIRKILKKQSESINVKLKNKFSTDQIEAIKFILSKSDARMLPKSPLSIYERNADESKIAKEIFNSFQQEQVFARDAKSPFLENDENNVQIIEGITVIIKPVVDNVLQSPEYLRILTQKSTETAKTVAVHTMEIEQLKEKTENSILMADEKTDFSSFYKYIKTFPKCRTIE